MERERQVPYKSETVRRIEEYNKVQILYNKRYLKRSILEQLSFVTSQIKVKP